MILCTTRLHNDPLYNDLSDSRSATDCYFLPYLTLFLSVVWIVYSFLTVTGYHGSSGPAGAQGFFAFVYAISTVFVVMTATSQRKVPEHIN